MLTDLLSVALGLVIGLSLGMLGGGGSILTVPALVYLIGLPVAQATGTSLAVVGTTALIGAVPHHRAGRVALRAAVGFGLAAAVGAVIGSLLGRRVPDDLLLLLFALLMLAAAVSMLRRRPSPSASKAGTARGGIGSLVRVGAVGAGVGVLTGFFGVGGGFLIVPALVLVLQLPMRVAVGTSLVIIAIASAAGLLTHLGVGEINLKVTLLFVVGGIVGTLVGSRLTGVLPEATLRRSFAFFIIALAIYLLIRNGIALVG